MGDTERDDEGAGNRAEPTVASATATAAEEGPDNEAVAPSASVEWAREYVYGTIATLVAVGGLTFENRPNEVSVGWVIVVGAMAITLAHAVSNLVVDWAHEDQQFDVHTVLRRLRQSLPILSAAIPATIVVALSRTGLWSVKSGLWISEGVGVAALAVIGLITAGRSRSRLRRAQYVVALVLVGIVIELLELAAHAV